MNDVPDVPKQPAPPRYAAFVVKAAIILAVALLLFILYGCLHERIEKCTGIRTEHASCLVFVVLSVSVDISTKHAAKAQGGHYAFDPAIAVVVVEVCKLVISAILFVSTTVLSHNRDQILLPDLKDILLLAVPGVVYTCNNILVFQAIEQVPMATFAVVRETRLVWNALIWMSIFAVPLGWLRWMCIVGVLFGCSANQAPAAVHSTFTWGVCYAFLLAFLNASGGVVCEFAMKNKAAMDINLQNMIIYLSCSSLALLYAAAFRTSDFGSAAAFFKGFQPACLQVITLQVIAGLAVSRILKHVESLTKSMVAALCGPIVCFAGSTMPGAQCIPSLGWTLHPLIKRRPSQEGQKSNFWTIFGAWPRPWWTTFSAWPRPLWTTFWAWSRPLRTALWAWPRPSWTAFWAWLQAGLQWHEMLSSMIVVLSCIVFLRQGPLVQSPQTNPKLVAWRLPDGLPDGSAQRTNRTKTWPPTRGASGASQPLQSDWGLH